MTPESTTPDSRPADDDTAAHSRLVPWTAWGFIVGSSLFALGAPLSLVSGLSPSVAGWVFFTGSIFFTTAALLQFLTSRETLPPQPDERAGLLTRLIHPRDLDWTAALVQFAGTILFNINTFRAATVVDPTVQEANRLIWGPDAIGSLLFLISGAIAFVPAVRARRHRHVRDRSWAMGAINLAGCVFFGLSALGALTLPASGAVVNLVWANLGTFLGAICFLVAAILLIPRRAATATSSATA